MRAATTKSVVAVSITIMCVVAVRFSGVPDESPSQSTNPVRAAAAPNASPTRSVIHQPFASASSATPNAPSTMSAVAAV